jgi:hypothetical protein
MAEHVSTSLKSAGGLTVAVGIFIALLVVVGCGGDDKSPHTTESRPSVEVQAGTTAVPNATNSGYAALAKALADPFLLSRDQAALRKELAQLHAEAQVRIVQYETLATGNPLLRRIADEAAKAGVEMIRCQQSLQELDQGDSFSSFVIGALGMYLGDPTAILQGTGQLLARGDARQSERIKLATAFSRSRAAQLMLPEAARSFGGPLTREQQPLISVDFDESFLSTHDHDTIALKNTSGQNLTNCTVLVEIRGVDGEVRQNVHFESLWEDAGERFARYGHGVESSSGVFGRRTVRDVQRIIVSVWSDQASSLENGYTYEGAAKDADVRSELHDKMIVRYRYEPTTFLSSVPRVYLILEGVPRIPRHVVELSISPKNADRAKPQSIRYQQSPWDRGELRTFSLKEQPRFVPQTMTIRVSFDGTGYVYVREVTLDQK